MKLLIFILIAYGISNIIIYGSIFKGWRDFWASTSPKFWGMLFSCFICLPTWVGFFGSWLVWSPTEYYGIVTESLNVYLFTIPKGLISTFLDGCLTSGCVWLLHTFQEGVERHFNVPSGE